MSRKTPPLDGSVANVTNGQVKDAVAYIASLLTRQENKETPTSVAALLRNIGGEDLRTTHRTTITRWLERNTLTKIRKMEQSAKNVVVLAEKKLRHWHENPSPIRIGMIKNSPASIPLHVLVHLSEKNQTDGVQFEPKYSDHHVALYNTLAVSLVDFILAPREHFIWNEQRSASGFEGEPVRIVPFCTIATVKTAAILPGYFRKEGVEKLFKETRQRIGILDGGGAEAKCGYFFRKYSRHTVSSVVDERNAFDRLKSQDITACLGHPQFIDGVMTLVEEHREDNRQAEAKHLQALAKYNDRLFEPVFPDIEMTIFVNLLMMRKGRNVACDLFHGLCKAMDYLEEHKFKAPLQKLLNKMLDVKDTEGEVARIFNGEYEDAYRFQIKDISAPTLRKLWSHHSAG